MLDTALLDAFLTISKTGSITAAAMQLKLTQPALSRRLKALEDMVGQGLFIRKKSGVELNAAGREFLAVCRGLDSGLKSVENWIGAKRNVVSGTIDIALISGYVHHVFPQFLAHFKKRYPDVKFRIEQSVSAVVEEKVLGGTSDIGIIANKCMKNSLKEKCLLPQNEVLLVCSPNYLRKRKGLDRRTLKADDMIWYSESQSRGAKRFEKMIGITCLDELAEITTPDMESCKTYACAGLGVALLAKVMIVDELKKGALIPLDGFKVNIPIFMISRNEEYQSPAIVEFKRLFAEYCQSESRRLREIRCR